MLSLRDGKPIAKMTGKKGVEILSIIDPDNYVEPKKPKKMPKKAPAYPKGAACPSRDPVPYGRTRSPKGRATPFGEVAEEVSSCKAKCCGGSYYCCEYCDENECQESPCCENCNIYYDLDSVEESVEESDDDEYEHWKEQSGKPHMIQEFNVPTGNKLTPIPDLTERFVDYVAGPSGSGKSTIAADLAAQFKKINPKTPIFIFSRTDAKKDPAFSKLKPFHQITLDESIVTDPIDITEEIREGGALMIFDDCNTIQNDKIKKEVEKIMSDAMEVGRKLNCNMIITSHLVTPNEKKMARTVLNEMHNLTVFPKSGSSQQIRYALKTYFGLNNKQIDKILGLNSRWVRISKTYPQYVLYDKGSYIL